MKLYYPPHLYDPTYRGQLFPLLKAFITKKGFTDSQRKSFYGFGDNDFMLTDTMEDAQVVILPMTWHYYARQKQLNEAYTFVREARAKEKVIWSLNAGDFGIKLPRIPNLVVFRQGGYVSNNQMGHIGFPSIIEDYVQKYQLENEVFNVDYDKKPIVGFCGQAQSSRRNVLKEMTKQALRNLRSHLGGSNLEPQRILATSYLRATLLHHLEANEAVDCRFIKREKYRAGITKNKETHPTTAEFYNNILDSQYVLCVRGAGNFSVRFYETLMMGRIPLYLHTDGYLPLSDTIDWKAHVVWVDYKDRKDISNILLNFHRKLNQEQLVTLMKNNRKLWEEKLTLSGFFKSQPILI